GFFVMQIIIRTIPHEQQRYPTTGDWQYIAGALHVDVSDMGNENYEALVGIHEAVEAVLCRKAGIKEELVTEFDEAYEGLRDALHGEHTDHDKMTLMSNFSE